MAPARINSNKRILDLTAGLGGTAVMLAREAGVWIDAYEPNPSLFTQGRRLIGSTPVSGQINLEQVEFHNFDIEKENFHVIYSRERLFATKFKAEVIEKIACGLKQNGQFLLTDYVVQPNHKENPAVQEWMSTELEEIYPWTTGDYLKAFRLHGLFFYEPTDLSELMADEISAAWRRMLEQLKSGEIDRDMVNNVIVEGQIWQSRVKALREGDIKLMRFNVAKKAS